jgi:hypothetical protein
MFQNASANANDNRLLTKPEIDIARGFVQKKVADQIFTPICRSGHQRAGRAVRSSERKIEENPYRN